MKGMSDAYRYSIRDEEGRQPLTRAFAPAKVSDVTATIDADDTGTWLTLWNTDTPLDRVGIDPQMADLTLWRYPIGADGDPVTHPVHDNRPE